MKNIELDFWPGGVRHCITFSYDDARFEDYRLVELFNKYNLKATFHICCPEWKDRFEFLKRDGARYVAIDDYKELYKGHEMSCHLAHHPFIYKLPKEALTTEIYKNKVFLEEICGYPVRGMSYPFGAFTDEAVKTFETVGMEYSRTVGEDTGFGTHFEYMKWTPTCHHERAKELVPYFYEKLMFPRMMLFNIWGHSYEIHSEEKWEYMESLLSELSNRDDTWYATNIQVIDYLKAMRSLKFTSEMTAVYNPAAIPVWIGVDGEAVMIAPGETKKL